jgi:hypothetical protein
MKAVTDNIKRLGFLESGPRRTVLCPYCGNLWKKGHKKNAIRHQNSEKTP